MSKHNHQTTLEHIFAHPMNLNIEWKKVEHLLESLGGKLEDGHTGRLKVHLNGQFATFARPHGKDVSSRDELMELRHFLEKCGVKPAAD